MWLNTYNGIFFDLDGTLVNLKIEWEAVRSTLRQKLTAATGQELPNVGFAELLDTGERLMGSAARHVAAEVLNIYEGRATVRPLAAGLALFNTVADRPRAIVSNNLRATVQRAVSAAGLAKEDIVIVGFDDVASSKPDPEGLLQAAAALGLDPATVIYVGDSNTDRQAAIAAKMSFLPIGN